MTPSDTLTILHLSDLHWSEENSKDQDIVITALLADIARLRAEGLVPDIVVFSGDLVQSGDDSASFTKVTNAFVRPITQTTSPAPLFICPGNHDISRKAVREAPFIETGLKADLTSVDKVNRLIDNLQAGGAPSSVALARLANYYSALPTLVPTPPLSADPLVQIYVGEKVVGVAAFDTAWRATGEAGGVDRHALILGSGLTTTM